MRTLILGLALVAGCPRSGPTASEIDSALTGPIDAAWAARASTGLPAVGAALDAVPRGLATRPEVAWRLARYRIALGELADGGVAARRAYALARGGAMDCLAGDRGVASLLAQGRTLDAVGAVPLDRTSCAAWAGYAWARWIAQVGGPAVDGDRPVVEALLRLGAVDADPERLANIAWGRVLIALTLGSTGDAPDPTWALLPDREGGWVRYEDLVHLAPTLAPGPPPTPPATPEDRAAAARLQAP